MSSHPRRSFRHPAVRLATLSVLPALMAASQPAVAAWPVVAPFNVPLDLVLVQAAPAAEAEMAPFDELNEALAAARSKLERLSGAADIAALAADLRRQLTAAEEANRDLRDQLAEAQAARTAVARRLDDLQGDLREREAALKAAAERAGTEVARVRKQLDTAEQKLQLAEQARETAEARLGDMQEIVESALGEAAELGQKMVALEDAAADQEVELADLRDRRDAADRALASERQAKAGIARELVEAREALDQRALEKAALEKQVAALTSAASKARDVAQQNLEAVEEKIRLLDQMIVDIQPAAAPPAGEADATPAARATSRFPVPPARPEAGHSEISPVRAANATESGSLAAAKEGVWQPVARSPGLGGTTVQLPLEKRVQAQSLLADLKAEKRPDGVVLNVPGEELFALDSESIESTAHDTLAKVAELIDLFDGREVKIIGHTDAMGDAAYNQALSERRARLVRDFFVHNYDVAGSRFTIAGAGERQPIATNTTRAGRRANRRIEVVIED